MNAADLQPNDELTDADGGSAIVLASTYEPHAAGILVFNFEVADLHTYHVRAGGTRGPPVWVHNAKCDFVSIEDFEASGRLIKSNPSKGTIPSSPSSPYITRIDPNLPGRPHPGYSIDTHTFSGGVQMSKGELRNTGESWQQWQQLRPGSPSKSNRYLIENYNKLKVSPRIDDDRIKVFPEHASYKGDLLIHHHVDFGQYAIPVPGKTHVGSSGV